MSTEQKERTGRTGRSRRSDPSAEAPRTHTAHTDAGGDGRRAPGADPRSVAELFRELSSEGAELVRQEVALAKAEVNHKVDVFQRNLAMMGLGGAFLLAALLAALWAVNRGLTALLAQFMGLEIAAWLSPLILAAVLAATGWAMIQKGRRAVSEEGLTPDRTKESLDDDREWVGRKAREMREEIQHG